MRIGYVRVSTVLQHTDRQEDALERMNVEKLFIEKISGKDRNRPQLRAMLDFVQQGDVVVISELSRLGRSMMDLFTIVSELKDKGASLESLKESIDLSSAAGNLTFGVMAAVAEFERSIMLERQREGIAAAKTRGKTWGRKVIYGTDERKTHDVFSEYHKNNIDFKEASQRLGMKKGTFYYRYNKWKDEQQGNGLIE